MTKSQTKLLLIRGMSREVGGWQKGRLAGKRDAGEVGRQKYAFQKPAGGLFGYLRRMTRFVSRCLLLWDDRVL
jgi:hypothetical protein